MAKKSKEKEPISEDLDDEEFDEEYDDDFEEDDDEDGFAASPADSADDPYWWTPHLVLGLLLLTGLLGFFGLFNNVLGFMAAKPHSEHKTPATAAATVAPAPKPAAKPQKPAAPVKKRPPAPTFGAKHLLVQYKGSMRAGAKITRTKEDAKKRADKAAKKVAEVAKANPNMKELSPKFSEVVAEYSDEPGAAKRGGDLGRFRKGSMTPKFQEAVEKLKVGGVSGVVETPFGYHVILRTL